MISAINSSLIIPLAAILVIQYCLALFALMRLFKTKPGVINSVIWNIIIVLLIIIGPILYLIIEHKDKLQITKEDLVKKSTEDYSDYTI